jgi:hypothetical protein
MIHLQTVVERLSESIKEFAEVIGMPEAMKIAQFAALQEKRLQITFPAGTGDNHMLRGVISDKAFGQLKKMYVR